MHFTSIVFYGLPKTEALRLIKNKSDLLYYFSPFIGNKQESENMVEYFSVSRSCMHTVGDWQILSNDESTTLVNICDQPPLKELEIYAERLSKTYPNDCININITSVFELHDYQASNIISWVLIRKGEVKKSSILSQAKTKEAVVA